MVPENCYRSQLTATISTRTRSISIMVAVTNPRHTDRPTDHTTFVATCCIQLVLRCGLSRARCGHLLRPTTWKWSRPILTALQPTRDVIAVTQDRTHELVQSSDTQNTIHVDGDSQNTRITADIQFVCQETQKYTGRKPTDELLHLLT